MTPEEQMRRLSRRGLLWALGAVGGTFGGWRWLVSQPKSEGVVWPLRRGLEFNEGIWRPGASGGISQSFPDEAIEPIRTNGREGLQTEVVPLRLELNWDSGSRTLIREDLDRLPVHSYVTELRCVEGWSRINKFEGVRLSEFLAKFAPGVETPYLSFHTPNGDYYVGIDRESAMHPQSLLCFAMNGAPLKPENGAPLRLAMPNKYGYKQIKNIGKIELTNERPLDYWTAYGYDWFGGL